jgi:uncharacterized protein (TIGR02145 family)
MATNLNGLIYYKLDAGLHGFPGDMTKNCGLRGEEIDGNFNFLRGEDIKSISFDEKGNLLLTRYNGEIVVAKQTDTPEYDFNYDPTEGNLTIVTPDGKEVVLTGFKITTNIYHGYTLDGSGLQTDPIEVSNLAKTGRYLPAIKLIDTTREDMEGNKLETLPTTNVAMHDRYVTKEKISRFGKLFPLTGVEKIAARLKSINSEWHVPSKEEWDELLNVVDCPFPEHDKKESNIDLGEIAGAELKAVKYWKPYKNEVLSDDTYGFSIYPVGYCGNRGKNYYGSFGEAAAFWTSTIEDNHKDMYVKAFSYDKETVAQYTWGERYYLSLRLVKKFTGDNFNEAEDIDGFTSSCVHVPGTTLVWTRDNIAFSNDQYDGFAPEIWKDYENISTDDNSYDVRYFVNDWNGSGWDKHELREGEGIVLYEGSNGRMHEWLIVDGELVDSVIHVKNEFENNLSEIHGRIDEEIVNRENADRLLQTNLNNEISTRIEKDEEINERINLEVSTREESDNSLQNSIDNEKAERERADKVLQAKIEAEALARQEADNLLQTQIRENKINAGDSTIIVTPGEGDKNSVVKVNLPADGMIKADADGLYFDGFFGTF